MVGVDFVDGVDSVQEEHMEPYDVKMEDMPESFRDIAELIGLENAMALVRLCGGQNIYVPKYDSCVTEAKARLIYEEWKNSTSGSPYADLAKKYNYSENWVRQIIREKHMERMPRAKQLELF